jgi:hypothetical protein
MEDRAAGDRIATPFRRKNVERIAGKMFVQAAKTGKKAVAVGGWSKSVRWCAIGALGEDRTPQKRLH